MTNNKLNPNTIRIGALRNSGTFAEVYEGEFVDGKGHTHQAAIKILKKKWNQNEDLLNRLEDEAFLLDRIHHENIIKTYGLTSVDERPAIVMELVRGVDLSQLLGSNDIPTSVAFNIASSVCRALDAAYRNKYLADDQSLRVIHRDIKPANVMLNTRGVVKVLDFGASRFQADARKGQTTQFQFGSPKYMPSERKAGNRGVHVSDVYSLGIMLIELLQKKPLKEAPPGDRKEHDEFINQRIDDIDFNLPNLAWTLRAKELMQRICAYDMDGRISAKKCIPLLDAFAGQSKTDRSISFFQAQLPRLIKETKKAYGPGPLTGIEQEIKKVASNPSATNTSEAISLGSTSLLKSRNFWLSAAVSTLFTFMTLHIMGNVFSVWEKTDQTAHQEVILTENDTEKVPEKTTEEKNTARLSLEMNPKHFKKITILNSEEEKILSVKRSSSSNTIEKELPLGKYFFEAHIRQKNKIRTKINLQSNSKIACEKVPKKKRYLCTDSENGWSISITCSKGNARKKRYTCKHKILK